MKPHALALAMLVSLSALCAAGDLPSDILMRQYLMEAENAINDDRHEKAVEFLEKIQALGDVEIPGEIDYFLAASYFALDRTEDAYEKITLFLNQYRESDDLLEAGLELKIDIDAALREDEKQWRPNRDAVERARAMDTGIALPDGSVHEMAFIPGGIFPMGSDNGGPDESPARWVRLKHGFHMSKREFTQAEWRALLNDDPSRFKGDDLPVEQVSWNDVNNRLLPVLNRLAPPGHVLRLPTEAEWEYACGGGEPGFDADASPPGPADANHAGSVRHGPTPAGAFPPNIFGLYDMRGNVSEWCQDVYDPEWYRAAPRGNPLRDGAGAARAVRGGDWLDPAEELRAAARSFAPPDHRHAFLGFRLVMVPVHK